MGGLWNQDDEIKEKIRWVGKRAEKSHEQWLWLLAGYSVFSETCTMGAPESCKGPRTGQELRLEIF